MPDGKVASQFDSSTGEKTQWRDLPDKPVQIELRPFTPELAALVQKTTKIAAIEPEDPSLPICMDDLGDGLLCGQDQRFHITQMAKCTVCGHTWPFTSGMRAECPICHVRDDWFCADCQSTKTPLVSDGKLLCPTCFLSGFTRGLKRIMKFMLFTTKQFVTEYWIRSKGVEVRITDGGKLVVQRLD
jgi:hypothetical protein